jgi:hypothetical protein
MKLYLLVFYILSFIIALNGCSDNATVVHYDKKETHLPCLSLTVFPPDATISTTLQSLYPFQQECPYELQASRKNGITCNSNQNADKKALSNFPSGYIRLDVYKKRTYIYSYYKDLTDKLTKEDITQAFERLKDDLL